MSLKKYSLLALSATLAWSAASGADAAPRAARQAKKARPAPPYLVPPPPAYMPSILPELQQQRAMAKEEEKPANSVKKYIYTREGYEDPPPVQPNKHVTYWNNSNSPGKHVTSWNRSDNSKSN